MKNNLLKMVPLAAGALLLTGCYHPKSLESFDSAYTKTSEPSGVGDPGSFGGIADSTGGTVTTTTYPTSSKPGYDPLATTPAGKAARFAKPAGKNSATTLTTGEVDLGRVGGPSTGSPSGPHEASPQGNPAPGAGH